METSPSVILREIEHLLNLLDGVTVLESAGTKDVCRIELTIESHESHLLLAYCAEAANVHFHSWAQYKPRSKEAKANPPRAMRYRYYTNSRGGKLGEALEYITLLGAFITWEIYRAGKISGEEEKRLTRMFNACSKST